MKNSKTPGGRILLFALLLLPSLASADDMVIVHLASYHPSNRTMNETNRGVGVRMGNKHFAEVGEYSNSYNRHSNYVLAGTEFGSYKDVHLNILAGIVSGYDDAPVEKVEQKKAKYMPFIIPEVSVDLGRAFLLIKYIPRFKDENAASVIGVSVGFKF